MGTFQRGIDLGLGLTHALADQALVDDAAIHSALCRPPMSIDPPAAESEV